MNPSFRLPAWVAVSVAALPAFAQTDLDDVEPYGLTFRIGPRVQFNFSANLRDIRTTPAPGSGDYDNGFVREDSSGPNSPDTWNWNYSSNSQVVGGTNLVFQRIENSPRVGDLSPSGGGSAFGGELFAAYEVSRFRIWKKREAHWGFEVGYGYTMFDVNASGTASSTTARRVRAAYDITGIPLFPPPNRVDVGFSNPGPLLPRTPVSSVIDGPVNATSTLDASISSDFHTLKFGPWFDFPITDRFTVGVGLGYCTVFADAELSVNETTTYQGALAGESVSFSGRAPRRDWRAGWYAQARVDFAIKPWLGVFGGIDLQSNQNLRFQAFDREAEIKLGTVFGASAGVRLSF
jgi:hypothetical protein